MAVRTQISPTIAFSDPPPSPPILRGKNGRSVNHPMVTKATTGQNFWADWAEIAAMIKGVTSAHRTDRVTVEATLTSQ
jgi:hypothetical protein